MNNIEEKIQKLERENNSMKNNIKKSNKKNRTLGITLIALVITIIILLILATITIVELRNTNLFNKTIEARNKYKASAEEENNTLDDYANKINEIAGGITTKNNAPVVADNAGNKTNTSISVTTSSLSVVEAINKGIKVGDIVHYTPPSGKSYTATGTGSSNQTFTSEESPMETWKVWKIDSSNKTVEILSSESTKQSLYLLQKTGWDNGPNLINAICSTLYSNDDKGITARSINFESDWNTNTGSIRDEIINKRSSYFASRNTKQDQYGLCYYIYVIDSGADGGQWLYNTGLSWQLPNTNLGLSPLCTLSSTTQLIKNSDSTWAVQ